MKPAPMARLASIGDVARMTGVSYWRARRSLKRLWSRDVEEGRDASWMLREASPKAPFKVNLTALQRQHPALFEKRYVTRLEFEANSIRLDAIERQVCSVKQACSARGARLTNLERDWQRLANIGDTGPMGKRQAC